ncbi:DUF2345 domain-containing protein, partial [Photorhabdus tasmaniensis]
CKGAVITGISSSARRDRSFEMAFTAIPYAENICFRPELIPKPRIAGTLPARVSSTVVNDRYGDIDKDGLYRVAFDFDRAEWLKGGESLWVRLARPYAGDTYGFHWPLLDGTEVAIAFEGGDPDRPYIAHALHDSKHPDHVTLFNYKRNVLRTPANNKLRMDDECGREHIKLSTEYGGKSQLNLGYLVDSQQPHPDKRGEGFELRTDDWGVIRAGKGMFISADKQASANGEVLAMNPAISLVKGAVNQVMEWGEVTQIHLNYPPDTESLKTYLQGVDQLKMAAMLLSAPEGVGIVSPQTVMVQSGQAFYAQSAGEVHIASACRIGANATKAISLLAQSEGMRLVSGKGPFALESHGDELGITALKDVTVNSTQGHVQITAKNGLTLACGGAYIRLSPAGEIEIHGPGLLSLKGQHKMDAPAKQDFPLPDLPESVCKDCLKKAQEMAQGFILRK